jgi:predicted  nucleic acid-binding Zn-ribbon protein
MATMKERLKESLERLEQERDELRVRLHLGKAEAKQEWDKLDARIAELRERFDKAGDEAGDVMQDVGEAAKLLGDEIRTGFERLRRML